MNLRGVPPGFYSAVPQERVNALSHTTSDQRTTLMAGHPKWPMMSPGSLNAWLVFLGPSPGKSGPNWDYDPLPSVGGSHPGVEEYVDRRGFWNGIRKYARAVFPELRPCDAYAATMVRNLVEEQAATAPKGPHMHVAANHAVEALGKLIRPRLVIALGGARTYTNSAFQKNTDSRSLDSGILLSSKAANEHEWFSLMGRWETGEEFLYVSPVGIHPSIRQISREDTLDFLRDQSKVARSLNSSHNEPTVQQASSGQQSSNRVSVRRETNVTNYDPTTVTLDELVSMEILLREYTGDLVSQIREDRRRYDIGRRTSGSQLKLLTVAHGCPSTHLQARHNARRLADALVGEDIFVQTRVPRLHYAMANGGVHPDFSENYHPEQFWIRTNLGRAWVCMCAIHNTDYESCSSACPVGVQFNGRFLIDIVRENHTSNG